MGRRASNHSETPVRGRSSPRRKSPSRRERSPTQQRSSHRASSPVREKHYSRARSPERRRSSSPVPRSPSPRTKRLGRAQAEREVEKGTDKRSERNNGRESALGKRRERDADREVGVERKDRRSGRDVINSRSSRSRHGQSASPSERDNRSRRRSPSPQPSSVTTARDEVRSSRSAENRGDIEDSLTKMKAAEEDLEANQKQKPSFELSGKLASETNRVRGITLLFTEPPEARKPDIRWRLYVFKAGEVLNEPLYIHRQSCYLFGRERRVADIPTDHPSCSKQHAVIQYRQVENEQPDGTLSKQVRPYIMDLGSTNKTYINDNPIEPQRYYELFEKDTLRFGNSSREYVLLHENSAA